MLDQKHYVDPDDPRVENHSKGRCLRSGVEGLEAMRSKSKRKRKPIDAGRTNAKTFWTDAKDHLIGAKLLVTASEGAAKAAFEAKERMPRDPLLQPTMLLICSCLEAGFKAYLHHHGVSLEDLRDCFGHDLAELHGAMLTHADPALSDLLAEVKPGIDLLKGPYLAKHFSYRQTGTATYPKPSLVCEWLKRYLTNIRPLILGAGSVDAVSTPSNE